MTVQLARAFLNFLCLTVTWNWVQTSNSDTRTKNKVSLMSIPWRQCMAIAWNGTALDALRNGPLKKSKKNHSAWAWHGTQTQ